MAMQVVDAMAPFVGTGIIDMPKLANYVLQYGFGIKNAASFVLPPPPPGMDMEQAQGPQDMQQGAPQGPPQDMGGGIPGGM